MANPPPPPMAYIGKHPQPCFVCAEPTRRIRSMSHLCGPPRNVPDSVYICLKCDEEWTTAIATSLSPPTTLEPDNPPDLPR